MNPDPLSPERLDALEAYAKVGKSLGGNEPYSGLYPTILALCAAARERGQRFEQCPAPLFGFVPQTYGDAIIAGWIKPEDCEGHEWDNRTSAENARWMLERFLAAERERQANGQQSNPSWIMGGNL